MSDWNATAQKLLTRLNPYQRQIHDAVLDPAGPRLIRVLASAGSGKTNTIITTLADGLNSGVISPRKGIITTFTKKAAGEMKERARKATNPTAFDALEGARHIGTYHSIASSWLKANLASKFRHRWNGDLNLDLVPNPWDRHPETGREAWLRKLERASRAAGGPSTQSADLFQSPPGIMDDIISSPDPKSRNPTWKTDKYRDPRLPLDLRGWYERNDQEPPEQVPTGRDYALAIGMIRGYGIHPKHSLASQTFHIINPLDENEELVLVGPQAVAELYSTSFGLPMLWDVWTIYEQIKDRIGAFDFEDMLYYFWRDGTAAADLVIVDEAQDNTWLQLDLARKIADRGGGKLVQVGDIRQSIYSFRGANPAVMRDSDERKGFVTLEIPTNYRSGSNIVLLGSHICYEASPVSGAPAGQIRATWAPGSDAIAARRVDPTVVRRVELASGEVLHYVPSTLEDRNVNRTDEFPGTVRSQGYQNASEEAAGIAGEISSLLSQGVPYKDIAILARGNAQGAFLEIGLLSLKIPVIRIGRGISFFDSGAAKTILDWLAAAYADDGAGVAKVLTEPNRGVYMKAVYPLLARMRGQGARAILRTLDRDPDANKWRKDFFEEALDDLEEVKRAPWPAGVQVVIEKTLADELAEEQEAQADADGEDEDDKPSKLPGGGDSDLDTARTVLTIAHLFETYADFAAFRERLRKEVKGYSEAQIADMSPEQRIQFEAERESRIVVSTIHGAKGLEWPFVFVSSSRGTFPSARTSNATQAAEERRLFYVAETRAADVVTITYSNEDAQGRPAGPSSFITTYVDPFLAWQRQQAQGDAVPGQDPLLGMDIPGWTLVSNRAMADQGQIVWRSGDRTLELLRGEGKSQAWGIYWSFPAEPGEQSEIRAASLAQFDHPQDALSELREVALQGLSEGVGADLDVLVPAPPTAPTVTLPPVPVSPSPGPLGTQDPPEEWIPPLREWLLRFPTTVTRVGDKAVTYVELAQALSLRLPPGKSPTPTKKASPNKAAVLPAGPGATPLAPQDPFVPVSDLRTMAINLMRALGKVHRKFANADSSQRRAAFLSLTLPYDLTTLQALRAFLRGAPIDLADAAGVFEISAQGLLGEIVASAIRIRGGTATPEDQALLGIVRALGARVADAVRG